MHAPPPPPRTPVHALAHQSGSRAPAFEPGRGTLVLGYEQPDYVSEAMRSQGRTVFKLGEHVVPALVPRFVKDHPAITKSR